MLIIDNDSNKSSFRKTEESLSATNEESSVINYHRRIQKNFIDISKYDKRVGRVMSLLVNCVTILGDCVLCRAHYNCSNHRYSSTLLVSTHYSLVYSGFKWIVRLESGRSPHNDYGVLVSLI
ncbi:unnamed protein product [Trichobilharzia regenti]|nr:unnamed protein product [Trichobilharzia regenti]